MAQRPLSLNIENFVDPVTGKPISQGFVYIGNKDTNPEIEANRKTVVLVEESGTEVTIPPASQPIELSSGGVTVYNGSPVTVLVDGVYSVKVTTNLGTQVYYVPRANAFLEEVIETGLLIKNGSFENTTLDPTKPDDWQLNPIFSALDIVIDTSVQNHGQKALKFTSTGAGGAGAAQSSRFAVTPNWFLNVSGDFRSTAATTRTYVTVSWYDAVGSLVGSDPIFDEGVNNPVGSWSRMKTVVKVPVNAFFCTINLQGMAIGGTTMAGSTWFDNVVADVSSTYHQSIDIKTVASPWLFTGIPNGTKTIIVALKNVNPTVASSIILSLGDKNGIATTGFTRGRVTFSTTPAISSSTPSVGGPILSTNNMAIGQRHEAVWTISAADFENFEWEASGFLFKGAATGTVAEHDFGSGALSDYITQLQVSSSIAPSEGKIGVTCHV